MVLVDTNVLLDVLQNDARWADWSQGELESASLTDTLAINAVIYSELSMTFERIEVLEEVVSEASLSLEQIPREALFRARMAAANRHLSEDQARHRSARGAPLCRSMVMAG